MSKRFRHIKTLYFRWGRELDLEPGDCADILQRAGLIETTLGGAHYVETDKARAIPQDEFDWRIKDTLIFEILKRGDK